MNLNLKTLVFFVAATLAFNSSSRAVNSDLNTDQSSRESESDQDLNYDDGLDDTGLDNTLSTDEANRSPIAAVYTGPGACLPCIWGAARAARSAGYQVVHVKNRLSDLKVLKTASIWVQPGGHSASAIKAVGPEYLKRVHDFVQNGGGYVGFCAGGFISTDLDGTTGLQGYNIVQGRSFPIYESNSTEDRPYIKSLTWNGEQRSVYFSGGPYFDFSGVTDPNLKTVATYNDHDHKIAAFTTKFGSGKIAISGAHPEELGIIKFFRGLRDPDGSDLDLAVQMMKFAKP